MTIKRDMVTVLIASVLGLPLATVPLATVAADLSVIEEVPTPPEEQRGIWGAIAYSRADTRHGFFWGADKKEEAKDLAVRHCENAGGKDCQLVTVFRNHRHWDDDDGTGFPYAHCGALAVGELGPNHTAFWGAAVGETRKAAEERASARCGGKANECEIREWVCT
ncbi:DUF4189 domain-containing protein [Ciceribacter sp. RN22]|uniref:DUF4189 domain-containing protein n=1 Tax=Ciceribacter sp. RN22 TaxID=2954932 RepID=UPI002093B19A|nr:DUF4189 domain-containing protein [Ciceribacter sp. RN22]MCO6181009.1 DUF4189 domain-containing protein [Ciceribacter sp. RN22]